MREQALITGLDHVQLAMPVGQEDAARAFYAVLLGLTEVAKPEPLQASGGCWFVGGGAHIHLGVQEPFAPATKAHPALLVSDLNRLRQRLTAANVAIQVDGRMPKLPRFYVSDPFGNRLEFVQDGAGFSQK